MPEAVKNMIVKNVNEVEAVASEVDFVFSAVDMSKDEIKKSKKSTQKQKHRLCQITALTAGRRMFQWLCRRLIRSILK